MRPDETQPTSPSPAQEQNLSREQVGAIAKWIHSHKGITSDNLFGYTAYQYARSAAASVPYGLSMAGTWLAYDKIASWGGKLEEAAHAAGKAGTLGKYTKMFFASPLMRTSAMIGTSFSLYRATSKIGKWVNEYLFNPQDSLETTQNKLTHLPEALKAKMGEVYAPEFHSTLISAMVLGAFVHVANSSVKAAAEHLNEVTPAVTSMLGGRYSFNQQGWSHFWKEMIANPKANFIPQAAILSLGYALFFEMGDRRFKDKQMSRGLWAGDRNSIGSDSKSHPSLLQEPVAQGQQRDVASNRPASVGTLPEGSRMNDSLSLFTSEPSFMRFALRRFVPTAIGITGYTALKFRGAPLFFGGLTEGLKTWKDVPRAAWREGAATSLFFMIPWVSDKYAPLYDKVANSLEAAVSGRSYEAVVAGYQPRGRSETLVADNNNQPLAANKNEKPETTIAKPAEHSVAKAKLSSSASLA